MSEYRKGAHTIYSIQYHFVWVTKYRYKVLTREIGLRTKELVRQCCESREIKILKGHVSKDHVHILVSSPPKLSPSKTMQYIKGRTSRKLQDEYPELKKRFWGNHLWGRGYFCATVGAVTEEQIKEYIAKHDESSIEEFKTD